MNDPKKNAQTRITREELHRRVWQTEFRVLANELGINQRRLREICHQLAVPYPRRRYWQQIEVGKAVVAFDLPKRSKNTPEHIVIDSKGNTAAIRNPRLGWHPLISTWQRQRAEAASRFSQSASAPLWTHAELRILKILNAIFREVEKHGFVPKDNRQWRKFTFQYRGVEIGCSLRERNQRILGTRGATNKTIRILKPTGDFIFKIESYLRSPTFICQEWADKPNRKLEEMIPDIVSSLEAVGPVVLRQAEEEQERLLRHLEDEEFRKQEAERKRIDHNRWTAFVEYAQRLATVEQVEKLLALLESRANEFPTAVEGQLISDWLRWARSRLGSFDPRLLSAQTIFSEIANRGGEPSDDFAQ